MGNILQTRIIEQLPSRQVTLSRYTACKYVMLLLEMNEEKGHVGCSKQHGRLKGRPLSELPQASDHDDEDQCIVDDAITTRAGRK